MGVILRVSTRGQKADGSLDGQETGVCAIIREQGGNPIVVCKRVVAGYSEDWYRVLESTFAKLARMRIKKVVLATLSRLVRSPECGAGYPCAKPSPEQLGRIERLAEKYGLTVICLCPPGSSYSDELGFLTRLGDRCGRTTGTRNKKPGWCRERREQFMAMALAAVDTGKSYREAAKIANDAMKEAGYFVREISHETVRRWKQRRDGKGVVERVGRDR